MINARIKRKTNNLSKFIKRIQELSESTVESGLFPEQGQHPTAEMSYVALANLHAKGSGNLPARDVRIYASDEMNVRMFYGVLNSYLYKEYSLDQTLDYIGMKITDISQSYFGQSPPLFPNSPRWAEEKDNATPLIQFGYLQDAWSYRTSSNLSIRGL